MSHQAPPGLETNVVRLRPTATPHPSRVNAVHDFHQAQLSNTDDPAVAVVYFCITAQGQIRSQVVGVEPEHSAALATEIQYIAKRVAEHALGLVEQPLPPRQGNLYPLVGFSA